MISHKWKAVQKGHGDSVMAGVIRLAEKLSTSGTLRYMISCMISEVSDIKLISYDIDVYDIIRL